QLDAYYKDIGKDYGGLNPESLKIHLPHDQSFQRHFVDALTKVERLKHVFDDLGNQATYTPARINEVVATMEAVMEPLGKLSAAEKIRSLVNKGESRLIEFKSTFGLDLRTQTREDRIVESSMKTVAGFLNSDGGDLLIGVEDSGNLLGVGPEIDKLYKGSIDKFLLNFKDHLRKKIGAEFYSLVDQTLVEVDGVKILRVNCQKSGKEVFLDGKDFYVRTNPATELLEGKKLLDYSRQRFP
ncbi:ATP-binding protein, partial [Pseudomonadales bacterium]|nr:ATP-binding protein [Pseudomonadales bacterium]